MIYFNHVKVFINVPALAEVIIETKVQYYGLSDSIVNDQGLVFISKFWFSLFYFFWIKQKLSMALNPQTEGQIKR